MRLTQEKHRRVAAGLRLHHLEVVVTQELVQLLVRDRTAVEPSNLVPEVAVASVAPVENAVL